MDAEWQVSRRGLLNAASFAMAGMSGVLPLVRQAIRVADAFGPAPESSPGSVRNTIAAFADTVVPGPAGHADHHPGAVEAGCVDELYDPFYGFDSAYPLVHADLQARTPLVLGRPASFDLALPYAERETVLRDRLSPPPAGGSNPLYVLYYAVAVVVYVAYYGNARSEAGPRYIGLPVHSRGYVPHHSYYVTFDGMTAHGNPD
ncbi:MAG TPA: hypothetical protein VHE56_10165 [Mycobacteriales bacterium]|nr:hypothetical protein [Mycobacteriales bacterium]